MAIRRHVTTTGILILMLSHLPSADTHVSAQSRLADVTELTCTFSLIATGTWTDGEPEVELDTSTLSFRFVSIDTDGATAEAVGPFGPSHIITRLSGDYLHFTQLFNVGSLYTTTIIDKETRDGKFMAVHTRHEYTDVRLTGFTSRPEQHYGKCAGGT